jgi:hypothetical protein
MSYLSRTALVLTRRSARLAAELYLRLVRLTIIDQRSRSLVSWQ